MRETVLRCIRADPTDHVGSSERAFTDVSMTTTWLMERRYHVLLQLLADRRWRPSLLFVT